MSKENSDSPLSILCKDAYETEPALSLHLAVLRNDKKSLHHWRLRGLWSWNQSEKSDTQQPECWWMNCRDDTPFHYAARAGDVALVKEYLNEGKNVFCKNHAKKEPLMIAAEAGHINVIQAILNHIPKNYSTRIMHALQMTVSAAVQRLLATALARSTYTATTSVHHMLWGGKAHALQALFEAGVSPSACNWGGSPPLHMAAWLGHSQCISVLLQNGASVNAQDKLGRTALHNASEAGDEATVDLLLAAGAETNMEDRECLTPLDLARSVNIRRLLKDAGAVE